MFKGSHKAKTTSQSNSDFGISSAARRAKLQELRQCRNGRESYYLMAELEMIEDLETLERQS